MQREQLAYRVQRERRVLRDHRVPPVQAQLAQLAFRVQRALLVRLDHKEPLVLRALLDQ